MAELEEWFLSGRERANPSSHIAARTEGNAVEALVHGSRYFDRLAAEVAELGEGDQLFLTDWRGDADELMRPGGPTIGELLSSAARRGVVVKGLMWRSHWAKLQYSEEQNRHLGDAIEGGGGEVLLDHRVRRGGSHHQKLVVLRRPESPECDVAFAGGIDLCHSRRDDTDHLGDPQAVRMSSRYGDRPPWHDVQLQLRGPVVGVLDDVFRERWTDPTPVDFHTPIAWIRDRLARDDMSAGELPRRAPDPPPCGPHAVQVLRTYPVVSPPYPFAPRGERTVARGYTKAIRRARRLIYIEDQYLWSTEVADLFAEAMRANPGLHVVAVVPRYPDVDGALAMRPNLIGREQALELCRGAAGDRVHVFDVENHAGTPVYVHAKVCVVDDVWACIGSDNFNRRSWSHDSELSCAVIDSTPDGRAPTDPAGLGDGARRFARDLRLRLLCEHLDRVSGQDSDLVDPESAIAAITASAQRLREWHERGRTGPRPPGRLMPHEPERVGRLTRLWALPAYRVAYDPDARPRALRRRATW